MVRIEPPLIAVAWPALVATAASALTAPTALKKVSVPEPTCVSVEVPGDASFTAPPSVRLPLPPMPASAPSVIAPPYDALPEFTIRAPLLPAPGPLTVNASAPMAMPLSISRVAPVATVVPPPVVPSALLLAAFSVPALIAVAPV